LKGIGLKDKVKINNREFQIHTGNDPLKNQVRSEVFEEGKFLFGNNESYHIRENNTDKINTDYIKRITQEQHYNTLDEIKVLFLINEKIKQIRQYLPHFRLGKVLLSRNFVQESISNFKRVVELNPGFIRAHIKLGQAYFKKGEYENSIKSFLDAYKLNPNYPDISNNLGVVYTKTGNFSAASKFLSKVVETKPEYKQASFNLGIVLFLSTIKDYGENEKVIIPARFIRSFKEIIKAQQYQSQLWYDRFLAAKKVLEEGKRDRIVEALHKLQEEIMFGDDSGEVMDFFFLQFMYGGKELENSKMEFFEDAINMEVEKNSNYADYWNELGIIHLIQCREYFLKAVAEFEKSNKIDPDYESARKNSDLLRHNKQGFLILLRAILK
jgi:tetratricopeptide (TPR) repeat protein